MAYDIGKIQRLYLGVQGEYGSRSIEINCLPWLDEEPNGTISIWHTRKEDTEAYPAGTVLDRDSGILYWVPTIVDTAFYGDGICQIRLTVDGVVRKSRSIPTHTDPAIPGTMTEEIPPAIQPYVDTIEEMKNAAELAKEAAEDAQEAAEDAQEDAETAEVASVIAQEAAETAQEAAEDAQEAAETAAASASGSASSAAGSASSAAGSASSAASSASTAGQYKTEAGQSATAAAASKEGADSAKNAALTAQDAAEDARDAAAGSASSAQGSATSAAGSATLAVNSATAAANSASSAEGSATSAQGSAASATDSASSASQSATDAATAKTDAVTAKNAALTAKSAAEDAQEAAETAQQAAEAAADSIEESAEQIEQNRQDIVSLNQDVALKADKTELAQTNRVISALVDASKGKTLRFETDDDDGYQKVVPSGALSATPMSWGGRSIPYNQLCRGTRDDATITDLTFTKVSEFETKISGSRTANTAFQLSKTTGLTIPADHVCFIDWGYILPDGCTLRVGNIPGTYTSISADGKTCAIFVKTVGITNSYIGMVAGGVDFGEGTPYTLYLNDLTVIYGAGNEPSSTDDYRIKELMILNRAKSAYNAGEIVSADVENIVVQSRNLFDGSTAHRIKRYFKTQTTWERAGDSASYGIPCEPNTTYRIVRENTTATRFRVSTIAVALPDDTYTNPIPCQSYVESSDTSMTITTDSNAINLIIQYSAANSPTELSVYTSDAISHLIPSAVLEQYPLRSAGSVYDTITFDGSKWWHTQNIGSIAMNNMTFGIVTEEEYNYFRAINVETNYGIKKSTYNLLFAMPYTVDNVSTGDKTLRVTSHLAIRDEQFSDLASFTNYIKDFTLYFEKSTPVITDITDLMGDIGEDLIVMLVESGGTITFKQTDTSFSIPNSIEYMVKISEVS